jgi:uncharacterized protein
VIVVSDSSPLIALAAVGQLHLLHGLFGEVLIPTAVWDEVVQTGRPGVQQVSSATWIRVVPVAQDSYLMALQTEVDDGEAEAMALAAEVRADLLLLDERRARDVAIRMGFKITGVTGVLGQAKAQGLVTEIRPILDAMAGLVDFRLARPLYEAALKAAGE